MRRLETRSIHNLLQPNVDINKHDITNTSLTNIIDKEETITQFQNKSSNETNSNEKKENNRDINEKDLEKEQSKTKPAISLKVP